MTNATTIKNRWSTLYVHRTANKVHISPNCRYVSDKFRQVDAEAFPSSHMDVCSWCENHFDNWEAGLSVDTSSSPDELRSPPEETFTTKPDPSEPWRYCCPECKSQVYRFKRRKTIVCKSCDRTFENIDELHDKKQA